MTSGKAKEEISKAMSFKVKLFSLKILANGSNQKEDKPKEDHLKEDKVRVPSGKETSGKDILKATRWMSVEFSKDMVKEAKFKSWK